MTGKATSLQPGALIVVNAIDRIAEGADFKRKRNSWPLHMTIVPWCTAVDRKAVDSILREVAANMMPFSLTVGDVAYFGPNQDVAVNVIADQTKIKALHHDLLTELRRLGMEFIETMYIGDGFRAHVTRHADSVLEHGTQITIDNLQLIELLENDMCHLLSSHKFGVAA